ncbi:polymerase delta-interacting protein 3 [Platysternon megacephalum]|uniref:Polymerase delta-interacting protein 3 n=1 Tax=Platysternon megacephalum TaxID=55544 RepID=A0A4D9DMA2_9SAUR|nr:polymerase delta-interacting protein 3 [Platysternon megacephalum]
MHLLIPRAESRPRSLPLAYAESLHRGEQLWLPLCALPPAALCCLPPHIAQLPKSSPCPGGGSHFSPPRLLTANGACCRCTAGPPRSSLQSSYSVEKGVSCKGWGRWDVAARFLGELEAAVALRLVGRSSVREVVCVGDRHGNAFFLPRTPQSRCELARVLVAEMAVQWGDQGFAPVRWGMQIPHSPTPSPWLFQGGLQAALAALLERIQLPATGCCDSPWRPVSHGAPS